MFHPTEQSWKLLRYLYFSRQQHQRLFSGSPYFALMLIYYTHYTIYYTEYITRTLLHEYHCFSLMSHSKIFSIITSSILYFCFAWNITLFIFFFVWHLEKSPHWWSWEGQSVWLQIGENDIITPSDTVNTHRHTHTRYIRTHKQKHDPRKSD